MSRMHERYEARLSAANQRVADGRGRIERMENLIFRAQNENRDTTEMVDILRGMRALQVTFAEDRDSVIRAIKGQAEE